ncbi:MAG: FAD-dependent oxidoreductase [Proteobacteria bacterium]|nr:FAD-dependent oxidoreductase [Pseudomonadota bacterium]
MPISLPAPAGHGAVVGRGSERHTQDMEQADIIIIGAGIMGLCTAQQIARRSALRVLVVEQGASLGLGSSGASSAVCRHRYTQDEMMMLARDGIHAYRHWPEFTGLPAPRATFHNTGALWINPAGKNWADVESQRMAAMDIRASVLDTAVLRERFPAINPCLTPPDLITGAGHACDSGSSFLFEEDAGYFDPVDALQDLAEAVTSAGVRISMHTSVARIITSGGSVTGIQLKDGRRIGAGMIVNATGPWCDRMLEPLGLAGRWPLSPVRIQVIHLNRPEAVQGTIPVVCDLVGGIYFREQNNGQQIVLGSTLEEDEREEVNPDSYRNWVDDHFKASKLHALQHRIPALPAHLGVTGYTGLYTVNTADVHPLVGPTEIEGLFVANGFSGHGFKAAPAIGSLLAQQLTGLQSDFDTRVSSDFLAFDRSPIPVDAHNVLA